METIPEQKLFRRWVGFLSVLLIGFTLFSVIANSEEKNAPTPPEIDSEKIRLLADCENLNLNTCDL